MMMRLAICVAALVTMLANAEEPKLEWSFKTGGKIYTAPVLTDLDNDGTTEIIVAASRDKRLLCLDGKGRIRWDYRIEDGNADGIQATPSVADYDGDGNREVFFITTGGTAGVVDCSGNLIWRVFLGEKIDYNGPSLGDINGDGRIEMVFGSESGTVYCLNDCGKVLWRRQGDGQVRGVPALARVGSEATLRTYVTFGGGTLACLSFEGEILWSKDDPGARKERRSGPAVGDLDADGRLEVLSATEGFTVLCSDAETGDERWRWAAGTNMDQTNSFALADFEGDGKLEVICADGTGQGGAGHVYRLRDGKPDWTFDAGSVVQGPSVGDVDGDGALEIMVCSRSKRMMCISADGQLKWSWPSETEVLSTPAIGDVDGDGKTEVVFTSKDYSIYCVTVDGAYDPAKMPWPMQAHDPQLSNNMNGTVFTAQNPAPAIVEASPLKSAVPPVLVLGGNMIKVSFTNVAARSRHLELTTTIIPPGGEKITRTVTGQYLANETHTADFDFVAFAPGTYSISFLLMDAGTGHTITSENASATLAANALPSEMDAAMDKAGKLLEALPAGAVTARGEKALAVIRDSVAAVLASAKTLNPDATATERANLLAQIDAVRKELARFAARAAAAAHAAPDAAFALLPDTAMRKVFKDEPYEIASGINPAGARIEVAGNEYEPVQIVVVPLWTAVQGLRLSSNAARIPSGGEIPADRIRVNRVGYIPIGIPEYSWRVPKMGEYPDVLMDDTAVDLPEAQDAQPFFVTAHSLAEDAAGDYAGAVRAEDAAGQKAELPLTIHRWGFSLDKETHLKTSLWMNEGFLKAFYKYPDRTPFDVRKRFYQCHLDHRISPIQSFPWGGGDMKEDFDFLMANGQNCMFLHPEQPKTDAEKAEYAAKITDTRKYLESHGWSDKTLFYSIDEVGVMQRNRIGDLHEINALARELAPEWPRLETSAPEQAMFGAVDVWCPLIDAFDPAILKQRMQQGERLWFYTVWGRPGIMIEFPSTDYRVMLWECWKYGAEGFLYWGTTHWDLNCTGDKRWPEIPWITYNRQAGHNGCGYMIYPGPDGTPLPSTRMAVLRDGIEDYECLWLLREAMKTRADKLTPEQRAEVEALLAVPDALVRDNKIFTEDPGVIETTRRAVSTWVEKLGAM